MNLSQAHHVSKRPGESHLLRGKNLSSQIVCWVTEIVNQPFPSKVHALTGRVNTYNRELRVISEAGRLTQYKDVGVSRRPLTRLPQELV